MRVGVNLKIWLSNLDLLKSPKVRGTHPKMFNQKPSVGDPIHMIHGLKENFVTPHPSTLHKLPRNHIFEFQFGWVLRLFQGPKAKWVWDPWFKPINQALLEPETGFVLLIVKKWHQLKLILSLAQLHSGFV